MSIYESEGNIVIVIFRSFQNYVDAYFLSDVLSHFLIAQAVKEFNSSLVDVGEDVSQDVDDDGIDTLQGA